MKNKIAINKTYKTRHNPVVRKLRITQDVPVPVNKLHLKRVIDNITKTDTKQAKHKMSEEFGDKASNALIECSLPSIEFLSNHSPSYISSVSITTLLYQLRKSLLKHDWRSCSRLMQLLIHSKQVTKRLLIYIIRSSLIILFNHENGPFALEEFLSISLGIIGDENRDSFLNSVFVLPERMKLGRMLENLRNLSDKIVVKTPAKRRSTRLVKQTR